MNRLALTIGLVHWATTALVAADPVPCKRCGWKPPVTKGEVTIGPDRDLAQYLSQIGPDTTVLLEDGEYHLTRTADIPFKGLCLRGKSGDPSKVIIRGDGLTEKKVGVALSISAPGITVADVTAGHVSYHGVQVRGEKNASRTVLHNIRVVDTGQQLLKGSLGQTAPYADDCVVACSSFAYTESAPSDYTNGVDVLGGKGWTVRDCQFHQIRGPKAGGWKCGPAILFWANCQDTTVERNTLIDCYRGIAFGLGPAACSIPREGEKRYDHQGGVIRQNVLVNLNHWADEAIEVNAAKDVRVEHNSVFVEGATPWSISVRFPSSSGTVKNNLTNGTVAFRNDGMALLSDNIEGAKREWFVAPEKSDLRLQKRDAPAVDACQPVKGIDQDFDRGPRTVGPKPDAGAFEYHEKKE